MLRSCLLLFLLLNVFPIVLLAQNEEVGDTLNIGLLISESRMQDARRGVELAVDEVNQSNFLKGKKVKLTTLSMEGIWGTGAKQTVDLVFNQKAWAIIGSHDGRNAHLAEQVTAKTQVVYISAWAGDPTLAQAYVPWFYCMVPNDIQQAKSLFAEIYTEGEPGKVVAVCGNDYDSETALRFFQEELKTENVSQAEVIKYDTIDFDEAQVLKQISESQPEVVILFGQPKESVILLKALRNKPVKHRIYGTFTILGENPKREFNMNDFEGMFIPEINYLDNEGGTGFVAKYKADYGKFASPTAAYAYDSAWLIFKKIRESGFDSELFKELMHKTDEKGVTGSIQFDAIGNRKQEVSWIQIPTKTAKQAGN